MGRLLKGGGEVWELGEEEGVGGVEKEVGKSEKRENEKGEGGDTCVLVGSSCGVLLSFVPGWGDKMGKCWSWPGRWLFGPFSPGGLLCVCGVVLS